MSEQITAERLKELQKIRATLSPGQLQGYAVRETFNALIAERAHAEAERDAAIRRAERAEAELYRLRPCSVAEGSESDE